MKLVRDRIPALAAANGHPASFHQASEAEFPLWLRAKLLEEAREAATASPAALIEELGDVLQVLYALATQAGYGAAEVECARARKARTHGAYTRRLIWQPTTQGAPPTTDPSQSRPPPRPKELSPMADRDYLDDLDPDDRAWLEAARRRARAHLWFLATLTAAAALGLLAGLARVRSHGRIRWQPPTA